MSVCKLYIMLVSDFLVYIFAQSMKLKSEVESESESAVNMNKNSLKLY